MLRRRQRPQQSDEMPKSLQTNPFDRLSHRNPLKRYLCIFILLLCIDLLLTITRHTYPFLSLPLIQHLIHTPGRDGTYAQNYQDVWLVKLAQWNANFNQQKLFFLDIGAYHGLWCSNSYLIEKEHGWEGACVEPFPDGFEQRDCRLFVNAMSDTDGVTVNFSGVGQERTIGSQSKRTRGGLTAQTISFPTLLKESHAPSFIAFISLDVEGHEYTALSKFPFSDYEVGAWIVEGHDVKVKELLELHGYKRRHVLNNGADEYYVADQYWNDDMSIKDWRVHPLLSWGC